MPVNKDLCIIIPVHSPDLTLDEVISLKACYEHLKKYTCFLVFPALMNIDKYLSVHTDLVLKPVDPFWLSSIENYNRMKVSIDFYEMFKDYTFMLTYELDAYIFSSNFEEHDVLKFDFIGAPFFEGYLTGPPDAPFIKGGNSGFSIRNIQTCIKVLKSMKDYYPYWVLYKIFFSMFPRFRYHLNRITQNKFDIYINGKLDFYFKKSYVNEDLVWSQVIPLLFPYFKVADPLAALQFSFEKNPERLLALNNMKLPMGCHAWPKYKSFWKNYINNIE